MKIGDEIVITSEDNGYYFSKGDRAVIVKFDEDGDAWADFNVHGNKKVYKRGLWCVGCGKDDFEVIHGN